MTKKPNFIYRLLTAVLLIACGTAANADTYVSKRLQQIDNELKRNTKNYNIKRRTNRYGEVEHIGLALFPSDMPAEMRPSCDFLERYLLEMNLMAGTERAIILAQQPVYYNVGTPRTALTIDSTCVFNIEEIEYHKCRAGWSRGNKKLLEMVYDLDWRMMSGCETRELEQNLVRNLKRHTPTPTTPLPQKGSYIISPAFNNDVYLDDTTSTRHYVVTPNQMSRSVANIMLADDLDADTEIDMEFNRYDDSPTHIKTRWQNALNYFRSEELCTPFFAIKKRRGDTIEGVLLLANRKAGYMHMLTVTVDRNVVGNHGKGTIKGRLIAYIPMHNVKQEYLNLTEYETIR